MIPRQLIVGARVGYSRIPLLGATNRQRDSVPLTDRLLETDFLVQLYHPDGWRMLGLQYTIFNFNANGGPDPAGDVSHRFVLALQLVL